MLSAAWMSCSGAGTIGPDYLPPVERLHRILVVDDEEIVLVALRETLIRAGYTVSTCTSPLAALEALEQEAFSVVISDQQMPKMLGLDFLLRVKELQPQASRILITAVLSLETIIDAINRGEIYRFIVKPWLREELLATVANAVSRFELLQRNAVLQATTFAMNEKLGAVNESLQEKIQEVERQNILLQKQKEALESNLNRSIQLCVQTLEAFYPTLGNEARRVAELCKAMGAALRLPAAQVQALEIAAWLHDFGLLSVPRLLIRKWQTNVPMDEDERALFQRHPILGQELARFANDLEEVGALIRAHHERFDGNGYPDGLQGDAIPPLARLLAVAVAYAESQADQETTLQLMRLESGYAFHPEAVRTLLRALPSAELPRKHKEVLLSELEPGMVLAKGIYTSQGLLLLPEGQQLSSPYIDKLLNHNRIQPI
ncbi:MAG TPA: HD domain-containing phosphohydrolase, partial [Methylomirabilota bacterium]|nr:HD domain-containing phosphohydrolase [Methylomirabilota bacterium]